MPRTIRQLKYSGLISPTDQLHRPLTTEVFEALHLRDRSERQTYLETIGIPDTVLAPHYVDIPGGKKVPQWSPTVVGNGGGFSPANDCSGNFMSAKFQPNNNCYNYSCDIATNSFAQPGRLHGVSAVGAGGFTGAQVVLAAEADGLIHVGDSSVSVDKLPAAKPEGKAGHFVALLISLADASVIWKGDYHWVRSDAPDCSSWSQKDGSDQITAFDFAGHAITDPKGANWSVNQGRVSNQDPSDAFVSYSFYAWMFVPSGGVNII